MTELLVVLAVVALLYAAAGVATLTVASIKWGWPPYLWAAFVAWVAWPATLHFLITTWDD